MTAERQTRAKCLALSAVRAQEAFATMTAVVKFTVNLQVVPRDRWAKAAEEKPFLGSRPSPNADATGYVTDRPGCLTLPYPAPHFPDG
jgi:hypothetical protein